MGFKPLCRRFLFEAVLPSKMFRIVGAFIASLVMHPFSVVHGLEAASTANETAKDETVTASSSGGSYECHLPLNCYAGHGADEVDYVGEVASISSCANRAMGCQLGSARFSSTWVRSESAGGVATSICQRAMLVSGTKRAASSSRACVRTSARLHLRRCICILVSVSH